jgi:cysteine desulfurase
MIYFDNAATTKPSKTALEKAAIYNEDSFFNPSTLYSGGLSCAKEIKVAKENILKNLGTTNHEVVFTSCGSESDNMAIFCAVKRGVFVTDKGEHSAVYKSFLELKNKGLKTEFISLNADGSVNETELIEYVKSNPVDFVSIVHVGNETGAINDINSIAKKLKAINKKLIFHSDGVQAYGKIPYRLSADVDLYSISAHKINALKGVGALIKRKNLNLSPLIFGGGQEGGLRSGTENVFGIKVFDFAGQEKYENLRENFEKVKSIKTYIKDNLDKNVFTVISGENSSPYILTVAAKSLRGEVLMHSLEQRNIIVGNGSACSSKSRFSRVIEACGYPNEILDGVIRISFSTENTIEEAKLAVVEINDAAKKLKGILS